ncbi:unnamed protein product, partial [Amoebophrya sp. A120]|eukprot:GSA120T00007093001.1
MEHSTRRPFLLGTSEVAALVILAGGFYIGSGAAEVWLLEKPARGAANEGAAALDMQARAPPARRRQHSPAGWEAALHVLEALKTPRANYMETGAGQARARGRTQQRPELGAARVVLLDRLPGIVSGAGRTNGARILPRWALGGCEP